VKRGQDQPTGWNPDLNDGAHLGIRPFLPVFDVGKQGGCIDDHNPSPAGRQAAGVGFTKH
jgi:hypothetical protein